MERRLAAIVAGDIVGYSRLMADDEAATYAALRSAFDDLIAPALQRHGGRTFKSTGDGFLATFPSVNEALDAAIEIQAGFDERPSISASASISAMSSRTMATCSAME